MRIAILLSGEYRAFDICRPTMTFLDDPEVDVYVSTWDVTHYYRPGINLSKYEKVTEKQISSVLNRPAKIKVESTKIQKTLPKLYNCSMIHRWKYGFKMIQDSGIEYDYVIITRFDLYFNPNNPIEIKEKLHLFTESLGSGWHIADEKLDDTMMISSFYKMTEFMNKLTIEKWVEGTEKDWHSWFYFFAKSVFLKFANHDDYRFHCIICRYISKLGDSFEQIFEHHMDWRDIQIAEAITEGLEIGAWPPRIVENALNRWNNGYFSKYNQPDLIAKLNGFSNSTVSLVKEYPEGKLFVRKEGDIIRNYEKLLLLCTNNFIVPKIYNKTHTTLDMEYIHGIDMKEFLLRHPVSSLIHFIEDIMNKFISTNNLKDYSKTYIDQLSVIDFSQLPFQMQDLYEKLPKILPQSLCHGDFTLENLIYSKEGHFYMIDAVTGPYDSWVFDIAKMRQDIDGHWFIRNQKIDLSVQLKILRDQLYLKFSEAFYDSIYILMLLRVYKHCKVDSKEHSLIIQEIKRIWN